MIRVFQGLECEDTRRSCRSCLQSEERRTTRGGEYLCRGAVRSGRVRSAILAGLLRCAASLLRAIPMNTRATACPVCRGFSSSQSCLPSTTCYRNGRNSSYSPLHLLVRARCVGGDTNAKGQRKMADGLRSVAGNTVLSAAL